MNLTVSRSGVFVKKILAILPFSIAGSLIIRGLALGFKKIGCNVLTVDIRDLDYSVVESFSPDFAIGYDYAHFMLEDAQRIIEALQIPVLHYFADDPDSNFAHVGDLVLKNKLENSAGIVFCWDRIYLDRFKNRKFYLPLGVDEELYAPQPGRILKYGISFVGRPLTVKRQEILATLVKNFPDQLNVFCYKNHFERSIQEILSAELLTGSEIEDYKNSYRGYLQTESELSDVYSTSRITLNVTMDQGISSMNYRIFEVLSAGGLLLTDYTEDIAKNFTENKEVIFYKSKNELIEKISFYLKNPDLAEQVSTQGRTQIINYHTFSKRAEEILEKITK